MSRLLAAALLACTVTCCGCAYDGGSQALDKIEGEHERRHENANTAVDALLRWGARAYDLALAHMHELDLRDRDPLDVGGAMEDFQDYRGARHLVDEVVAKARLRWQEADRGGEAEAERLKDFLEKLLDPDESFNATIGGVADAFEEVD